MAKLIPPKTAFRIFNRAELKVVYFTKSEDGLFWTSSKFLNKDTLTYRSSKVSIFTEDTLQTIISLYLKEYSEYKPQGDWVCGGN